MFALARFHTHLRTYGKKHLSLYYFLPVLFFWGMFDTVVSYISPIVLNSAGFSILTIGFLIGTSSIWGAVFDFFLSKYFKNRNYVVYFKYLFLTCLLVPLFFYFGRNIIGFLVVMALWGVYYDLYNFGIFDFVGRHVAEEANVSSFGIVDIVRSLSMAVTPLIIGAVMIDTFTIQALGLMYLFLFIAILAFIFHTQLYKQKSSDILHKSGHKRGMSIMQELRLWLKVEKYIYPVLILITFLNIIDAFFWTLGPLVSESLRSVHPLGGLFITAYVVPSLFVGPSAGLLSNKLGKKKTAFYALMGSSLLLLCMFSVKSPIGLIVIIFFSSIFNALAWPAIRGAVADYIHETPTRVSELEGLQDFATNIGYTVGPILAGIVATFFTKISAFAVIGFLGFLLAIMLILITPKKITIKV